MGFKEKFSQFLSDDVGSADHHSLLHWGTLAVGGTVASLMIQTAVDATGTSCGPAGECLSHEVCCYSTENNNTLYWCSTSPC